MSNVVDFLCIGAPRAGTTWLWNILKQHPGIWMPPIKELHYFDRSLEYPSPSLFADDRFLNRLAGRSPHHTLFRSLLIRSLIKFFLLPPNWRYIPWISRYLTGRPSDAWYLSLFQEGKNAVKGEITPAYSILSERDVRRVHALLPDLKVIYLIRNPVERAWSDMRFQNVKGKLDLESIEEVINRIDHPAQVMRSDYARTISLWRSVFPVEKVLVGFFDEIISRPEQMAVKMFTFLGVDPNVPVASELLSEKVNAGRERSIPTPIKHHLAKKYHPEVEKLIPLAGGYCQEWMRQIEGYL